MSLQDATGRWYCCNDSDVTVSNLQEVLSQKVYILFFARTNQKTKPTKTAFPHIGKKSSPVSNGNAVSVNQKETVSVRPPLIKANGIHQSEKDTPVTLKADKVPSNPGIKFNLKKPGSQRTDANGNGTVKVHNNASIVKHGSLEEPTAKKLKMSSESTEESRITGKQMMQSISNGNCYSGSKSSDIADCERKQQTYWQADNREIQNIGADLRKVEVHVENGTGNTAVGRVSDPDCVNAVVARKSDHVSYNGTDGCSSDIPGYKRELLDTEKIKATPMESSNLSGPDTASDSKLATFKEM